MATPPRDLQVGTSLPDAYQIINENFRTSAQDIRDFGANTSTSVTVTFPSVGASSLSAQTVVLVSPDKVNASPFKMLTQKSTPAIAVASPFLDIWIDTQDDAHRWLSGGSLTAGQSNFQLSVPPSSVTYANSLAAYTIQILNRDTVAHTYIVTLGCYYVPIGAGGQFR